MSRKLSSFRPSPLQWALLVSVGVHAALLTVRFVDPEGFNRVFQDTPLEVILVNARSSEPPEKAQAIAQVALAGGGEADAGRATTPLPRSPVSDLGDSADDMEQKLQAMQKEQNELLSQIRRELATLRPTEASRDPGKPESAADEQRRRQLLKLLGEIEKRIHDQNARPKRRYVGPSTLQGSHAAYYDQLRQRIETRGTQSFPEYQGKKLYGELTMLLTVDAQGRLVETEVVRSSGSRELDRRAEAIARAAAPFGSFPSAMHAEAEQFVFTARFRFSRDEGMAAQVLSNPQ